MTASVPNDSSPAKVETDIPLTRPIASPSLNLVRRAADLERIRGRRDVDVLVIGGGITGCGVALDAAARGLTVALVESGDLAQGTSRWSSKLIHGGLRYLRHGAVGLAWESARERHILMIRVAPHLVSPMPFVVPLNHDVGRVLGGLTNLGVHAGNGLRRLAGTPSELLGRPRHLSPQDALGLLPGLRHRGLRGAIEFYDGRLEDDVRLVLAVARTAAHHGAAILTRCRVVAIDRGIAAIRDEHGGEGFELRSRAIVNATGVWATQFAPTVRLRPSKGAHVIVRAEALGHPAAAMVVPVPGESARWLGASPIGDGLVLVGVTDTPYESALTDEPAVEAAEEVRLLEIVSRSLGRGLRGTDVVGRFAGLRPLAAGRSGATADLSRRQVIVEDPDTGVITITGGKLTTYRAMAEAVVDRVCRRLSHPARTTTRELALVGAAARTELQRLGAPPRLVARYGTEAPSLVRLAGDDRELLAPIAAGVPVLGVELLFGLRHECAITLDDLLDRRVRLGLVPEWRAAAEDPARRLLERYPSQ